MSRIKILLAGAGGQLGTELQRFAPAGCDLVACDQSRLDVGDAGSVNRLVQSLRPEWIINAAAYTAVDRAESEPAQAMRVNADGARNLAEAAEAHHARVIQVSTDFVFDGEKSTPYLPEDAPNPLGVYGQSKLAGERLARHATGGSAVIVRTAWVYATHGRNFVRTVLKLLRDRAELRIVADQIGTPTSAASLARALWRLIEVDVRAGSTLHFTDEGVASWYDLAVATREIAATRSLRPLPPVIPIRTRDYPTPARRPAFSVLDQTETRALLGPGVHWREPLRQVVATLLEQQPDLHS